MEKAEVLNPILLYNTPGQELAEILISNNFSPDDFLRNTTLNSNVFSSAKFTLKELDVISSVLNNDDLKGYFLNFQTIYKDNKSKIEVSYKESLKIFKKVSHILPLLNNEFNDGIDILEDIADFLNIDDEKEIFENVEQNIALYKISNFKPDSLNLYAWLRRGKLDFDKLDLPNYNKEAFLHWIENAKFEANFTNPKSVVMLPAIFSEFGVALVYTPYLEKTVHGAVRWFNGRPLIQISDKGKCLATFWYTLLHEIGHVILHENVEIFEGTLDLPKSKITKIEQEANAYAYDRLFHGDGLRKYVMSYRLKSVSDSFISSTASRFNVPEIFVAFWMKKAQVKNWSVARYLPTLTF